MNQYTLYLCVQEWEWPDIKTFSILRRILKLSAGVSGSRAKRKSSWHSMSIGHSPTTRSLIYRANLSLTLYIFEPSRSSVTSVLSLLTLHSATEE